MVRFCVAASKYILKNCFLSDNDTISMTKTEQDFHSMQYALYFSLVFEILASIFFLITTLFVVADREKAEDAEKIATGKAHFSFKNTAIRYCNKKIGVL